MIRDYMESSPRLYRSRRGMILGVCRGIAEHFNLSVFWTRVAVVCLAVFTGFWLVIGLYLLAALLMKREPRWLYYAV